MVDDLFEIFAEIGKTVNINDPPIKKVFRRLAKDQNVAGAMIYNSTQGKTVYIDDACTNMATLSIQFPDDNDDLDCYAEFDFLATVIKVIAYPASQPNKKQIIDLVYHEK